MRSLRRKVQHVKLTSQSFPPFDIINTWQFLLPSREIIPKFNTLVAFCSTYHLGFQNLFMEFCLSRRTLRQRIIAILCVCARVGTFELLQSFPPSDITNAQFIPLILPITKTSTPATGIILKLSLLAFFCSTLRLSFVLLIPSFSWPCQGIESLSVRTYREHKNFKEWIAVL